MKIMMLACLSGVDFTVNAGEETDRFDDAEAKRFIEAGFAVPVVEVKKETAVKRAVRELRGSE